MTDTKKLRELAEAATQGEWEYNEQTNDIQVPFKHDNWNIATVHDGADGVDDIDNGLFIAAANPAAIIALLDRLESAEKDAARYARIKAHCADLIMDGLMDAPTHNQWCIEHLDSEIDASMQRDCDGSLHAHEFSRDGAN